MNGNLEPEERVYDCAVQAQGKWLGELAVALESLGWDRGDNVAVEIAGTSVYEIDGCLLYTSPSPRDVEESRMPSSA